MSFRTDAAELFGLSRAEAGELLEVLEEEEGFDVDTDSLYDDEWGPLASDYLEDVVEDFLEVESEYELDDYFEWGHDDWIEAGEEYEVTVTYKED